MSDYHLGINMGHDRSAAVVRDGEIVVAIEQERLDRKKHSIGFLYQTSGDPEFIQVPGECLKYCMDSLDLPLLAMTTITANMPGEDFAPRILRNKFSAETSHAVREIPSHHLAHAYSAYWPSGFSEALVLVVDATGTTKRTPGLGRQTESYSLYRASGCQIEPLHSEQIAAHLSSLSTLGFVYEYVSRKAGFVTNVGTIQYPESGKLMGLAAYGAEQPNWRQWFRKNPGSYSLEISAYDIFLEVAALEKRHSQDGAVPYLRPWLVDLAYKVQKELEEALEHVVELALRQTGLRKLCMAGGVALNSVANYRLLRQLGLDDMFVFPAAGDSGIAAGCAFWAYHQSGGTLRPPLKVAALGHTHGDVQIVTALDEFSDLVHFEKMTCEEILRQTATSLATGSIVARFEQGAEFGPRALGHRSILADPTFQEMKAVINARVKFREAFRPFAPVIPLDRVNEVFVLKHASPFMLLVSEIRPEMRSQIPAVAHADGTGRVQTVDQTTNPFFYQLCNAMVEQRGGPPVILNTSFNVAGQPIVETPREALQTLLSCDLDYLALGDYWVSKKGVPVKDYQEHLRTVPAAVLPHGLGQPDAAVTDLMEKLDRALFFQEGDESPWTPGELQRLSTEGGRFRETSRLFPKTPFYGGLRTQLSDDVVLVLDPLGQSSLVDQAGRVKTRQYDLSQVKMLLAALNGPQDSVEDFRLSAVLTHLELRREIDWARGELGVFGLVTHAEWSPARTPDSLVGKESDEALCAAFEDASFSQRIMLEDLNAALHLHGYHEGAICALLGCDSLQTIEPTHLRYYDRKRLPDTGLADLVRLFLLRTALPMERIEELLGNPVFAALCGLGVLVKREDRWASRVDLFCSDGLFFATDHRYMFLAEDQLTEQPVMYIGMDSHGLVQTAPRSRSMSTLDLCCGSGIQGIVASRYSRRVVSVDVNPRAVRVARFNTQLNGVENLAIRRGDLFEPVRGERFDVVLANPPFVPSPHAEYRFRDGGANGEQVLRRIIQEAAAHLTPRGRIAVVTDLVNVDGYGTKLDSWWSGDAMDQLVLKTADRDALLFCVPHSHAPFGQTFSEYNQVFDQWVENFEREGLESVNFGYLLMRQSASGKSSYFCRTVNNPATPIYPLVEDYFGLVQRLAREDCGELKLRVHPALRVRSETDLAGVEDRVELCVPDNPYFTTYPCTPAIVRLLQDIQEKSPRLREVITESNGETLRDLLRKGILEFSLQSGAAVPAVQEETPQEMQVREDETKTTPTCLSSYLA